MKTLLVLTTGQTDVQLVDGEARRELDGRKCAALHDEIERRDGEWQLVSSPLPKAEPPADRLPEGPFALCTPKLDAVLKYMEDQGLTLTAALVLGTRRDAKADRGDPRFAGEILEKRLRSLTHASIERFAFLTGNERYNGPFNTRDAVIRKEVADRIGRVVSICLRKTAPDHIILATTGGMPPVKSLVEEVVRLYAPHSAKIDPVEVPDGAKADPPTIDQAISRSSFPEPAASYQARRHAQNLIEKGNLLGAWGAVEHLDADDVEHRWTQVVKWLADFAASLPISDECDIDLLKHPRKAVRSSLRVELALLAGDIPRGVHGTVAFFECALWDHLEACVTRRYDHQRKLFVYKAEPVPIEKLVWRRPDKRDGPFELVEEIGGVPWYKVWDDEGGGNQIAKDYLKRPALVKLGQCVSEVRELRNDVAHNEPTSELMKDAHRRMAAARLWSPEGTFLAQPMVQDVLRELGEADPARLCTELMEAVRARLLAV